jgi:hypothetical protein
VITAKWETRCGLCNRPIPKGREIALLPDRQRWRHPACVEEQESASRSSAARAYRKRRQQRRRKQAAAIDVRGMEHAVRNWVNALRTGDLLSGWA